MNTIVCRATVRSSGPLNTRFGRRAIRSRPVFVSNTTAAAPSFSPRPLSSVVSLAPETSNRFFSDAAPAKKDDDNQNNDLSSPKLQGLYDRVIKLPSEDVNILGAMVLQILGRTIFPGQFGTPGGNAGGALGADGGANETSEAVEEEKTSFDVKLLGFDAKSKIKVIKEIRAIAGLGLKEAKELVESAPKVFQKNLKKDAADELKEKMEALGAQIEII